MRYKYVLLVATSYYKEALVDSVNAISVDNESFDVVIVLNSDNNNLLLNKYSESFSSDCLKIFISPQLGKSNALNFYLKSIRNTDVFIIFSDDDIVFPNETIQKYITTVEKTGRGFYYGGGVDVILENEIPVNLLSYYPDSIKGISEEILVKKKQFLGCNWGAFASDLIRAGFFNPYFGPGSITNATGQERIMMSQLEKAGICPFVLPNARVTHIAPKACNTNQWLFDRIFRNSIKFGLLHPFKILAIIPYKFLSMLFSRDFGRKFKYFELMGMLRALKFNIYLKTNIMGKRIT